MGNKCHFAHGDHELRSYNDPIPTDQIEAAQKQQPTFQKQFQPRPFRQGPPQMPGAGNNFQQPKPFMGGFMGGNQGGGGGANFKTVKCKFFDQGKTCPYGNRCSFAHGENELRQGMPGGMMPPPMPVSYGMGMPGGYMGGAELSPDMMYAASQGMMGAWGGQQYPGMDQAAMMQMMGGAAGFQTGAGVMDPSLQQYIGGAGSMYPDPYLQQQQQQIPQQTRIQIQQQEINPDGSIVLKDIMMDVYFLDTSPDTLQRFQKATQFMQEGANNEGMEIIQSLYSENKIMIQPAGDAGAATGQQQQPVQ